jgi:lipid II:glycine glycyltransferase (peptidoglycan interpeptide bridge formation enzyme)
VQFGIINELTQFDNYINKQEGFIEQVKQQRIAKQNSLSLDFGLTASFRENMPLSNIIYDVTKTDEQLMSEMNSGCRERIKKAIKNSLNFRLAHPDEYDIFYQKRCDLGGKK